MGLVVGVLLVVLAVAVVAAGVAPEPLLRALAATGVARVEVNPMAD